MYHRLLEEAIAELKGERSEEVFEPEITLPIPAFIPPEYIPDEHLRLHFYKRVAGVGSVSGIEALASEMFDRFGSRPPQLENLLRVVDLKIVLRRLRIATADFSATGAVLKFDDDTPVSAQRLVDLVRSDPARYRLSPDSKLIVTMEKDEVSDPIGQMKNFLRKLG